MIEKKNTSRCIGKLLKNDTAYCEIINVGNIYDIVQPTPNHIVTINFPKTNLTSSCKNSTQTIVDTNIIYYQNCSLSLNDITYSNSLNEYWDDVFIPILQNPDIQTMKMSYNITLEKLVEYHFEDNENNQITFFHIKTFNLIHLLITCLALCLIIYIYTIRRRVIHYLKLDDMFPKAAIHSGPTLLTRGGGVTLSDTTTTLHTPPPPKPNRLGSISAPTL